MYDSASQLLGQRQRRFTRVILKLAHPHRITEHNLQANKHNQQLTKTA
jgi:hypothetical protein